MAAKTDKTKAYRENEKFETIRADLIDALEKSGSVAGAHSLDLIEQYMDLWCHYQLLKDDVNLRGVYVNYNNGGGQKGTKRNDSLQDELKVSAQMLKIRESLGIKDVQAETEEDEL